MATQEYQIGTKAFTSKEEFDKYVEISNYIDKFCSTADILNTVSSTNKYVEAIMNFCDNQGDVTDVVKVFSPILKEGQTEREIFAQIGSKVVRLGVESAFEYASEKAGITVGTAGIGTIPAYIMGAATGGATYLGYKFVGVGVGHYAEKYSYEEFIDLYDKYIDNPSNNNIDLGNNQNITSDKIESVVFLDTSTNEKTTFEINQETVVLEPIIVQDLTTGSIVSLKSGQTISHIAANTEFTTMDLLKYNNLTLEQAKNLPVGYEIQIPKSIENFDGGYGNIKLYTSYDGTLTYYIPNEKGNVNVIKINSDGEILQNDFDTNGTLLDEIVVNPNDNQSYNDAKTMEELLKDPNNLVKIDDGILYADSGQIKTDVNYDKDSQTLFYEDENGNLQQITYEENSDLLIYGDVSNPNKITFTDKNGNYQVWEKDNEGNFVQTNKVDYSGVLNTAINQIGSLIIMNNQDFSNIEKIAVSTTVSTIADFATYKGTDFNTTDKTVSNLQGAVVSFAVSSFFAKNDNISDILGMDGTFLGGLAENLLLNTLFCLTSSLQRENLYSLSLLSSHKILSLSLELEKNKVLNNRFYERIERRVV